jgi:hypothetical protein
MAMTAAQKQAFAARMAAARAAKTARSSGSTAIIVAPPAASRSLGAPPKAPPKSLARRIGSAATVAAVQEKQLVATVITGGAIGYLEQEGWLNELPEVQSLPIGKVGVLAVTSYLVNRFLIKDPETKKIISGVTNASAAIASYQIGKGYALKAQAEKLLKGEEVAGDLENEDNKAGI